MEIGDKIRQARKRAGLTQEGLAGRLGVHPSAVGQWETNRTGVSRDNLLALARLIKIDVLGLVDHDSTTELRVTAPKEIEVVTIIRRLPDELADRYLELGRTLLGAAGSKQPKPKRNPAKRRGVTAGRSTKQSA